MGVSILSRTAAMAVCALMAVSVGGSAQAGAQEAEVARISPPRVAVTEFDAKAASTVTHVRYHVTPAAVPGAKALANTLNKREPLTQEEFAAQIAKKTVPTPTGPVLYPGDLVSSKGKVVTAAQSHAIYVNCTPVSTCWGNPEGFLTDLGKSSFIHLTDQYVGSTANNRYTVGKNAAVSYSHFGNTMYPEDLFAIVHAVAKTDGTGYGHIYHIFLPKGTDTCFDQSSSCYSPDNPGAWAFCAYHESVTFSDIGHVLMTVEPYQNVAGCNVQKPNPNGQVADSTNSVLSHELIEAITDPDPDSGWTNITSLDLWGYEIGDECQPLVDSSSAFLVPTFLINGKKYEIQLEYSNKYHGCVSVP
jgi:hypothetical protein